MADALTVVTSIALMLSLGILVSYLCRRWSLPETFMLILVGMGLAVFISKSSIELSFPPLFLAALGIIALAITVFNAASGLKLREFDSFSWRALKLVSVFTVLELVIFSLAAWWIAGIPLALSVLFAALISGTSPDVVLNTLDKMKSMLGGVLKLESIFNTPLSVLIPLLVIDIVNKVHIDVFAEFAKQVGPFLSQLVTGLGTGIFVGILLLRLMKRRISDEYSPLALFVGTLATYVLAENLGGSGVLAVTALGVFFGTVALESKKVLITFESLLGRVLYILVFVLVGFVIQLPLTAEFWLKLLALLIIYYSIRYWSFFIVLGKQHTWKERLFGTLNAPKGIPTVTLVFTLAVYNIPGALYYIPNIKIVLDYVLAFVLTSVIISGFAMSGTKFFFPLEITGKKQRGKKSSR